jgi:hypothetical protein
MRPNGFAHRSQTSSRFDRGREIFALPDPSIQSLFWTINADW